MKPSKCYFVVNLDGCLEMCSDSQVDLTWPMIVGTTSCTDSLKLNQIEIGQGFEQT
jgi:hypothetical protein